MGVWREGTEGHREGDGRNLNQKLSSNCLQATCKLCKLVEVSPISSDAKGLLTP